MLFGVREELGSVIDTEVLMHLILLVNNIDDFGGSCGVEPVSEEFLLNGVSGSC